MDDHDDAGQPLAAPTSSRLTEDGGWEGIEFVEPDTDWQEQTDGSFLSPDGAIRSWPQGTAEEA